MGPRVSRSVSAEEPLGPGVDGPSELRLVEKHSLWTAPTPPPVLSLPPVGNGR